MNAKKPSSLVIANRQVSWHLDWSGGILRTASFENRLSGLRFNLCRVQELTLVFSAAVDAVAEPLCRAGDFVVRRARQTRADRAEFELHSPGLKMGVVLHIRLDGPTRRKWAEVTNTSRDERLLLDVELDDFTTEALVTGGGGHGKPVFVEEEVFAAIEHPSGDNKGVQNRVQLTHCPGRRLPPGGKFRSQVALVSVAAAGQANAHFVDYIQARTKPRRKMTAIYTPFGINNQWGAHPTLSDEETLDVLERIRKLQKEGVSFDYFTLDTGWVDFSSDLTRFKPTSYPHGPATMIGRVRALGMKFGLWFATSWGLQSCWDHPPAFADGKPPTQIYREGYHLGADGLRFCFAAANYFSIFKKAILHHIRKNHVKFLKFDGGIYSCDATDHGHLPGKYATEAMHERLIDLAASARKADPDVFIMWYWGLGSPFWAMHGDAVFESGLYMEGSGTSVFPTLYYRDSVTLAQDQNAYHAKTIPPLVKDSLGVWLTDTSWGNYMGTERWRESIVMDLGRGSRLFPNIWGNLYSLTDADVKFLAWIQAFANKNAAYFQKRRTILGDPFRNEVYGYAHGRGSRSFLFLYNAHFASRRALLTLDASLGLDGRPGASVAIVSHFPDKKQLRRPDGDGFRLGDALEMWLRPFETLMLEVAPAAKAARWPVRAISDAEAADLGTALPLRPAAPDERFDVRFAEAELFVQKKLVRKTYTFESALPSLAGDQPILAIVIRLRKGQAEWHYAPTVVKITQAIVRIGEQYVQMIPVPDGRQHGNTQSFGCSWLVCKARLSPEWSHASFKIAVHANVPEEVEARVECWLVKRWWQDNTRPAADGFYTYESVC